MEPTAAIDKPRQGRSNEEQYQDMHRRIGYQRAELRWLNRERVNHFQNIRTAQRSGQSLERYRIARWLEREGHTELAAQVRKGDYGKVAR